ncbi:MAG: type II secretion system protein [Candidatus Kaiserbacteria bacterium]|nr:MAG: type II secretion system protein [Candidatus Kaiserbacteria bacterium]
MKKNAQRGFTLIELLVVIAIIGILSSVVLASLNSARKKGRDARRIADIKQLQLALELYYDAHPSTGYPTTAQYGSALVSEGFIASIPTDPQGNVAYSYAALGSGTSCTSYHLGASLEVTNNSAFNADADGADSSGLCTGGGDDFAGTDTAKCNSVTDTWGVGCYDVKP